MEACVGISKLPLAFCSCRVAQPGLQDLGLVADADVGHATRCGLAARDHARVPHLAQCTGRVRPRHRGVVGDLGAPARRVGLGEELGEQEGVTAAVGPVQRHDRDVGQRHARIQLGDGRVVPGGDGALVDRREHLAAQFQVRQDTGDVVGHQLRRDGQRDVLEGRRGLHLARREIGVRGADVGRAVGGVGNAGARAGTRRLDLHLRVLGGVVTHPDVEQRVEQGAPGLAQRRRGRRLDTALGELDAGPGGGGEDGGTQGQAQDGGGNGGCSHSSRSGGPSHGDSSLVVWVVLVCRWCR